MREGEYIESLISEYDSVLSKRELKDAQGGYDELKIVKELSVAADWSVSGCRGALETCE